MDGSATLKDPVCGMDVTPETAIASTEYKGTMYYFCSEDCYTTFTADPGSFT